MNINKIVLLFVFFLNTCACLALLGILCYSANTHPNQCPAIPTPAPTQVIPTPTPQVMIFFPKMSDNDEGGVYEFIPTPIRSAVVCKTEKLEVLNAPEGTKVLRVIDAGTEVIIWEKSQAVPGWAMIETAEWVETRFLCVK